ncbi:hypothetical protein [Amycolatopsis sp. NPDC051102]|uniref:hypothetical protein n=1 Tax=Amycolatopsis sp. NPDC051102 TaxID=3155163 RepID=UPI003428A452
MTSRKMPLNAAQREVLAWVRDGCAAGLYEDWSHRLVARALHNRGLLVVKGHGPSWVASITEEGVYYLENDAYLHRDDDHHRSPSDAKKPEQRPKAPEPGTRKRPEPSTTGPSVTPSTKPVVQKRGPVDQLMQKLQDAVDHRVLVPTDQAPKQRQLAALARRFGRIPEGMRLSFEYCRQDTGYRLAITLESPPEWQTRLLAQAVSTTAPDPTDVVQACMELDAFPVQGSQRDRAFRLLEALVRGAREIGMTVSLQPERQTRGYATRGDHQNEIRFALDRDEVWLRFTQATLQRPHEPTERELKRARQGYMFPDFDEVPDEHLGIVVAGAGRFWADSWKDTDEHRLEDDLVEVLEEVRLRLGHLAVQRAAAEERQRQAELERAERAKHQAAAAERAAIAQREHLIDEEARDQARRWSEAGQLRAYAAEVHRHASSLTDEQCADALSWADRITKVADALDPFPDRAVRPHLLPGMPTASELQAFRNR